MKKVEFVEMFENVEKMSLSVGQDVVKVYVEDFVGFDEDYVECFQDVDDVLDLLEQAFASAKKDDEETYTFEDFQVKLYFTSEDI